MKFLRKREKHQDDRKEENEIKPSPKAQTKGHGSRWSFGAEKSNIKEGMDVLTRHSGKTLNALGQDMWQHFKNLS